MTILRKPQYSHATLCEENSKNNNNNNSGSTNNNYNNNFCYNDKIITKKINNKKDNDNDDDDVDDATMINAALSTKQTPPPPNAFSSCYQPTTSTPTPFTSKASPKAIPTTSPTPAPAPTTSIKKIVKSKTNNSIKNEKVMRQHQQHQQQHPPHPQARLRNQWRHQETSPATSPAAAAVNAESGKMTVPTATTNYYHQHQTAELPSNKQKDFLDGLLMEEISNWSNTNSSNRVENNLITNENSECHRIAKVSINIINEPTKNHHHHHHYHHQHHQNKRQQQHQFNNNDNYQQPQSKDDCASSSATLLPSLRSLQSAQIIALTPSITTTTTTTTTLTTSTSARIVNSNNLLNGKCFSSSSIAATERMPISIANSNPIRISTAPTQSLTMRNSILAKGTSASSSILTSPAPAPAPAALQPPPPPPSLSSTGNDSSQISGSPNSVTFDDDVDVCVCVDENVDRNQNLNKGSTFCKKNSSFQNTKSNSNSISNPTMTTTMMTKMAPSSSSPSKTSAYTNYSDSTRLLLPFTRDDDGDGDNNEMMAYANGNAGGGSSYAVGGSGASGGGGGSGGGYANGNSHGGNDGNGGSGSGSSSIAMFATLAAYNCCSNLIALCCSRIPMLKAINVRRCVLALFAITVVTILYYTHYVDTGVFVGLIQRDTRPSPLINCRMINGQHMQNASPAPDHRSEARLRIDPKVLVFVETTYSSLGRDIAELLVYNRIKYKIEVAGKSLPVLTNLDKGRYGVIVFENLDKYLQMDKWNRELLDKYCREYSVGVVGFVSPSEETLVAAQLRDFPLFVHTNLRLRDASLNPASSVLRLTRAGETAWGILPGDDWAVFQHNHSTYEPVAWAQRNTQDYPSDNLIMNQVQLPLTTVLLDHGQYDGIQRVLFGSNLRFWLHRILFLDAISYLSHGQLSLSLDRMILVDIDDIFVGEKGTRLRPDDVRALIATQKMIASMIPGFRFNLGFSGKYYHHGTREENLGDDFLLQNVNEFNWFSHMWKHQQPHLYDNLTQLMAEMQLNYAFAKEHNIPTDSGYSISPHHSGVYPAHEILYIAWKKVWNIKVTSTEEYPHLRPARLRRGFIHRDIMVLPRQTCGLFTHTMYIDRYPGGRDKLDESIQGGELFQTIVYNPVNIFMTHMSNYGSDRLALYTFQSVIKFLQCWTNIKLASARPVQLAEMYFRLHPDEVDPIWGNPCDDSRHKKIWSKTKNCDSLPKFLVIGPQKTGTTALYTFLSMHSNVISNIPSPDTFEEIQFFNGNNYYRGLDWYMDFFPSIESNANTTAVTTASAAGAGASMGAGASAGAGAGTGTAMSMAMAMATATATATLTSPRYMFEKSATYFDGEMVPKRAHALLPHAKIVSILISPAKRAYSWYQHQRAHGDVIANNYSFYQVITATDAAPKSLRDLRNRCLNPGKYAQHLEHWLAYYPAQQLHIIDGEQLRLNPVDVMNELQRFLKIQPNLDYSNHLRFDVKKGFFCQVVSEKRNKCLGKSKGRQYPPMDDRSAKLLQRYYLNHNTALVKLLKKLGSRPIPQWLKDDLSTST